MMGNTLPYYHHCQNEVFILFEFIRDPNQGDLLVYAINRDWDLVIAINEIFLVGDDILGACLLRLQTVECECLIRNA